MWKLLALLALAATLRAGVESDLAEALRLGKAQNPMAAIRLLERAVDAEPAFQRGWRALVDVYATGQRLPELDAWLSRSASPGACLGRMLLLRLRKAPDAVWESEVRNCAARLPGSFAVYTNWIGETSRDRLPALAAELAAQAAANPHAQPLQFAAAFSLYPKPVEMRQRLERIAITGLDAGNANDLDDALYLAYAAGDPRRTAAVQRLLDRARARGDEDWIYRAAGRLGLIARDERRYNEAITLVQEARRGAEAFGRQTYVYDAVSGECLFRLGRPREAIQAFERSHANAVSERNSPTTRLWPSAGSATSTTNSAITRPRSASPCARWNCASGQAIRSYRRSADQPRLRLDRARTRTPRPRRAQGGPSHHRRTAAGLARPHPQRLSPALPSAWPALRSVGRGRP